MQSDSHYLFQLAWISGGCALLGALAGSMVSGYFTLRAKRSEYLNDFFKIVICKRVEAYEHLEALIQAYKSAVIDTDKQPYHSPFATSNQHMESLLRMGAAINSGLWLTDATFDSLQQINYIQFRIPEDEEDRIRFGKEHYRELAKLRDTLERQLAADMLDLHRVREFLTAKRKHSRGFHAIDSAQKKDD
jgi:hypothetical protein